jgi:hypothetical protein
MHAESWPDSDVRNLEVPEGTVDVVELGRLVNELCERVSERTGRAQLRRHQAVLVTVNTLHMLEVRRIRRTLTDSSSLLGGGRIGDHAASLK